MRTLPWIVVCAASLVLVACAPTRSPNPTASAAATTPAPSATPVELVSQPASQATATSQIPAPLLATATPNTLPSPTATAIPPTASATPRATLAPDEWQTLPVIPTLSERARAVYLSGLELGNNPNAFSKLGDCESSTSWFLNDFDLGAKYYRLGEYDYLSTTIEQYQGSFSRRSLASRPGFSAASLLSQLWADRKVCQAGETPLDCEYRIHRPSFAFIVLGSNDAYHRDVFEEHMRTIIEASLEAGVVPILTTKADNLEGDQYINATIARLAWEYELPLWNFWLAVQSLPDQGLQEDGVHLTWSPNFFDDPQNMKRSWPVRNLNALQVLYSLQAGLPQK